MPLLHQMNLVWKMMILIHILDKFHAFDFDELDAESDLHFQIDYDAGWGSDDNYHYDDNFNISNETLENLDDLDDLLHEVDENRNENKKYKKYRKYKKCKKYKKIRNI